MSSSRRRIAAAGAVALVAVVAAATLLTGMFEGDAEPHAFASVVYDPPEVVPGFTLTSQSGEPLSLNDLRGDVVVLYFGYTHCPDVCPLTLSNLAQVRSALPEDLRDELRVVMLAVDPERDTPEALAAYMPFFDSSFVGVSGSSAEIQRVLRDWRIRVEVGEADAEGNYSVGHPSFTLVLNRDGERRLKMNHLMTVEQMTADLLAVLREG